MTPINSGRVWRGAIAGGIAWTVWSFVTGMIVGEERYMKAQADRIFLGDSRIPVFLGAWILCLFALSYAGAWLYAHVRRSAGPGPGTAACVGAWLGFAAGFPANMAQLAWLNTDVMLPIGWIVNLWGGAIIATLIAGWLYRE